MMISIKTVLQTSLPCGWTPLSSLPQKDPEDVHENKLILNDNSLTTLWYGFNDNYVN